MSTTLEAFGSQIDALSRLEIGEPARDGYGQRYYPTDAGEAMMRLLSLSQDIRSIAWAFPFQAEARGLASRADEAASRIARENGLMGGAPLPRKGSVAQLR